MDLSNVTVLIPAHNRPERLRRLLAYYGHTNIEILVPDSSTLPFPFLDEFPSITYRHQPGMEFLRKINEVLPLIHTDYVFYCADDDFIVPEAVKHITEFMDSHSDYCTAQGHFLTFEAHKGVLEFYPRYIRNFNKKMDGNSGIERLNQYNNLYASMLYSVCRSGLFKEMYSAVMDSEGNPRFTNLYAAEEYYNIYTLIHGKHYTSSVFYSAREWIKGSASYTTVPFTTFITAAEYKNQYDAFIDILANKLAVTDSIPIKEARDFILSMINKPRVPGKLAFKQRISAFVDKHAATQWISNLLYERYKSKGRKIVENMESYPIYKNTPEKQAIIESIRNMK